MRLTVYTDYSLRLLMYLALKDGGLATIADVAKGYDISKTHLMKVAHQLGVAGYVTTVRGRQGGLRLAKPLDEIGLGEVVRHTEPDMALVPCFRSDGGACPIQQYCLLAGALDRARSAFLAVLDEYSLKDLVRPRSALRGLLHIEVTGAALPRAGKRRLQARNAM